MSKQDVLKVQTCILKVYIHCDGCEHKVKKLLQKIDGVYSVSIDAEKGKVLVSGNVDPGKLIKKLNSSGKHAELWGGQKGMMFPTNQFKNLQIDNHGKGGKDNRPHKGGKDQQKGGVQAQLSQFQAKGAKDLKLPFKDHKSVKFNLPEEEFYASDNELDDYDEFDDDFDDYDDEEDEEEHGHGHGYPMPNKMMPMGAGMMNGQKGNSGGGGGKNAKKGDVMDLPMQIKGKGGNNESKNGKGGKKGNGDGGKKNKGGGKGGNKKNTKGSGGLLSRLLGFGQKGGDDKNKKKNKGGGGGGGGNNKGKGGKKGREKFEGHDMNNIDDDDLDEFHIPHHGKGGKGGKGSNDNGKGNGNVGQMGPNPMGHMGAMEQMSNIAAVQGLPAMNGGGYYQGMQMQPPPQYNLQQQYMAMMMNHNQHLQPHLNNMYPPPMMYSRPYMPPPAPPPMPVPPMADPVTHAFSDENTESCTIM